MMKFETTEDDEKKIDMWSSQHKCDHPDCSFQYRFTQTGIGLYKAIKCQCGVIYDFSEYDKW